MAKTKILRFCHKYLVDEDGYDIGIQELTSELSKDFEQHVMLFLAEEELESYKQKNNLGKDMYHEGTRATIIPIIYDKQYNDYTRDLYLKENIVSFREQFMEHFERIDPEIIHIHGTLLEQFYLAAKTAKREGKRVIVTHHLGLINQHYHRQKLSILLRKFLFHNYFPFIADKVTCLSEHGRNSFLFRNNVIIAYAVKHKNIKPYTKSKIKELLNSKNLSEGRIFLKDEQIFFYPARYSHQKNQSVLLQAFGQLLEEGLNLKLVMVGKGYDKSYLKKLLSHNQNPRDIMICGALSHQQALRMTASSDFLIHPGINEGLGRTGMESLAVGTPVLAADDSGHQEYIEEGENGLLFNSKKPDSIVETVKKALDMSFEAKPKKEFKDYLQTIKNIYGGKK